jgi:protocatechuate 3,4-dioxygenase beta subunit
MSTPMSAVKLALTAFGCLLITYTFGLQARSPEKEATGLTLQGRVLQEPDGQPVRKATVQLAGVAGQYSAVTDTEGRFAIDDLKAGRYVLVAEHPGLVQTGSRRVLIALSQDKSDVIVRLQPAAVITGKITDVDGDPMRDVGVTATRVGVTRAGNRHDFGNGSTNDLGEFRISDLRPGRYTVVATPQENLQAPSPSQKEKVADQFVYVATYYPGTVDKDQSAPVEAQGGGETPINFSVLTGKAYHVTGDVQGLPSSDIAQITLTSEHGFETQQQLGPGGKFDFPHLMPGTYHAQAIIATVSASTFQSAMQVLYVNQSIEVNGQDIRGLHLQVDQGASVKGKMRIDTAQTFDWTQLMVTLLNTEMGATFQSPTISSVAKDGTFEVKNVPHGKYYLVVAVHGQSNQLRDYFTKAVMLNGQEVGDSGFASGPGTYLDVVISARGATVEGTVVDEKGKPVPSVTVIDVPDAERRLRPDLYQQDTTDVHGHFSLRGLNPGSYTVLAFEELQENVRDPEFLQSYGSQGQKVELDEGTDKSIVVKLIPAAAE